MLEEIEIYIILIIDFYLDKHISLRAFLLSGRALKRFMLWGIFVKACFYSRARLT